MEEEEEDQSLNDFFLDHMQPSNSAATTDPGDDHRKNIPIIGKFFLVILTTLIITLLISASISINSYLKAFKAPIIEVDSVTVYPFIISSSSSSSSSSSHRITANWSISINIANPEYGTSYYYEDLEALILLKDEVICKGKIGELVVDGGMIRRKTVRIEKLEADWVDLDKSTVDALRSEWRRDGVVSFSLRIDGTGRKGPEVDERKKKMNASCDDLRIGFIYNTGVATLITPSIMCSVHIYDNNKLHL